MAAFLAPQYFTASGSGFSGYAALVVRVFRLA
jgi:hypothetical protein